MAALSSDACGPRTRDVKNPMATAPSSARRKSRKKKICKSASDQVDPPRKICKTDAEWEYVRERSVAAMAEAQESQETLHHTIELYGGTGDK